MVLAWPSSPSSKKQTAEPAPVAKAEPAAAPAHKVEARLVDEPEVKTQTKVTKLQVKSTVRKTPRRGRR